MPWDKIHGKYCYLCSLQKTKSIDKKLQQSYFIDIYVLLQNCMYIKECLVDVVESIKIVCRLFQFIGA